MQINIGATNQTQGRYAYTLRGLNPDEVYSAANQICWRKMRTSSKGFQTVQLRLFQRHAEPRHQHRPRPREPLRRVHDEDRERSCAAAYSENYVYLIKQPDDQYQVILEADDKPTRAHPEDLDDLYVKADDGKTLVPMRAVTTIPSKPWACRR